MEDRLRDLLGRVRRRWFKLVALRALSRAAVAAAIPIALALAVDLLIAPQGWALILLAAACVVMSIGAIGFVLLRMQRLPSDRLVARYVEERSAVLRYDTPLNDEIVSAVDVAEGRDRGAGVPFKPLILAAAVERLERIEPADIVEPDALRRAGIEVAIAALILASVLVGGAPSLRRAAETAWIAAFPETIELAVVPGNIRVIAGQPIAIRASVRGSSGLAARLAPSVAIAAGDERRSVPMVREGDDYRLHLTSVDGSFRYRVTAGIAVSSEYTVTAVFPARVERIDLHYQYPAFTGLAARDEPDGGDIYAPAGTRVRLRIHTDKTVAAGDLALGSVSKVSLQRAGDRLLEGVLTLARDDSYRVNLADADGLRAAGDTEYFIRLMDDRPPDVRIIRPSRDQQITPLEEVAIEARADDDYGVAKLDLVYSVSGGAEKAIPFTRLTGTDVQKTGAYTLAAEELGVQPGDVITYYARARDVGRGRQSTEAKSDMFFLEVKPFGEEFVAAQSQGGGAGAGGSQIESLIAAQKEIINATWNLERRSGGGRSEADIKAVAQAQAELRTRVEQMARGGRGGPRGQFPQRIAEQPAPQRAGDPLAGALAAMTDAQQQLESQRTREAIPHEMAALNALLKAQAEVRRRQVMQQRASAGGGGGSNRSGEDLSALFDKELQRQQRTNFETRSQVEQRPDKPNENESALDRIRDLARRQEELARQQRELAGLPPEEQKRRLEKLTREQTELREEAEKLSRQMNQQGQGGMRDASEQMRGATSDLRRENAAGAADKGQRAAEQLRRLEERMRGSGGGQQGSGELQMEAQQIAGEQRRIATEAERLDREGSAASGDARRRLADEKERLASRVDELQRRARRAAQGGAKGAEATAAAEAARELERQQVGQRMRDTAGQLRKGEKSGAGEQQISRALDRVADALGAGNDTEARRLSDQLQQTRDIRDRLNRLERQLRDAEAGQSPGAQRGQRSGEGRSGRQGTSPGSGQGGEIQKLREEYQRELQRARETLGRLQQQSGAGSTPEEHEFSRSAPGTEQFKQDRSRWESLRRDVDLALERYEAGVSARLAKKSDDRLSAGGSDRVPDKYRERVAKYFESLAAGKRKQP